jgi:putative membrane protein
MKVVYAAVISALGFASVPVFAESAGPTDPQIASIVVTANQVDIDAGKYAESKTNSAAVKQFAALMVTDHSSVNKAAADLAHKLGVTPQDNPTSQSLKHAGDENIEKLKALSGEQLDRAYVDHEVAYHQLVLDAMDKALIPSAQNQELKDLLVKVRPAFVQHLEHAKHLQATLGKGDA